MNALYLSTMRALVAALKSLARTYGVRVDLTRDSLKATVERPYGLLFRRRQRSSWIESEQMWRGREGRLVGRWQVSSWVGSEQMWSPPGA